MTEQEVIDNFINQITQYIDNAGQGEFITSGASTRTTPRYFSGYEDEVKSEILSYSNLPVDQVIARTLQYLMYITSVRTKDTANFKMGYKRAINVINTALAQATGESRWAGVPGPQVNVDNELFTKIYRGQEMGAGLVGDDKFYQWQLATVKSTASTDDDVYPIIVRPQDGSGSMMYHSDQLDKYVKEKGGRININLDLFGTYPSNYGALNVGPVGFKPRPQVLAQPQTTLNDETGLHEFKGSYTNYFGAVENDRIVTSTEVSGSSKYYIVEYADGKKVNERTELLSLDDKDELYRTYGQNIYIQPVDDSYTDEELNTVKAQADNYFASNTVTGEGFGGVGLGYTVYGPQTADVVKQNMVNGQIDYMGVKDQDIPQYKQVTAENAGDIYGGMDHINGQGTGKVSWISLSSDEKEAVQLKMVNGGYMTYNDYLLEKGRWGTASQAGMKMAMTEANLRLQNVETVIEQAATRPVIVPPISPKKYTAPTLFDKRRAVKSGLSTMGFDTSNLSRAEWELLGDVVTTSDEEYFANSQLYEQQEAVAQQLAGRGMFDDLQDTLNNLPELITPEESVANYAMPYLEAREERAETQANVSNDITNLLGSVRQLRNMNAGGYA